MSIQRRKYTSLILPTALLVLLAGLPAYVPSYTVILVTNILMYVVMTLSWVIFSGPTGYISLAPAAFFGVGVYASAIFSSDLPLPIVILIGGAASFCLAYLVGSLTLRLRGMYFTMFTFGLVELVRNVVHWYEVNITGTVGRLITSEDTNTVFYAMATIFLAVLITSYLIGRSRFGLALQSIGESEEAAAHTGINVNRVKTVIFAVSAFFMGLAGATMCMRWSYIDPTSAFNVQYSFMPVLMAIFGGVGHLYAPIAGATLFALLEEVLTTKFPYYYMLIFGLTMLAVILFMPRGLEGVIDFCLRGRRNLSSEHGEREGEAGYPLAGGALPEEGATRAPDDREVKVAKKENYPACGENVTILEAKGLNKHFGGLAATTAVDLEVRQGEILGLIGPNGAGKTTLFNLLSGALKPDSGTIRFKGTDLAGLKPHQISRMGIARTFQSVKIFSRMSVFNNVLLGHLFGRSHSTTAGIGRKETAEILEFVELSQLKDLRATDLILANQKRLEVARALATNPDLLLLDELMAGLTPTEIAQAMELVKTIRDRGVTIVMIEHVMKAIMSICDRIVVLHHGEKIAEGTPEEIARNKTVIEVYLGE